MSDYEPITVRLTLRPTRPRCDVAVAVRWMLKTLLRVYGLRCTRITWTDAEKSAKKNCTPAL